MNNPNWKNVVGTIMFEPPRDMPYSTLLQIIRIISQVTKVEGGYESSFTLQGDLMFFHITREEAIDIESRMTDLLGEDIDEPYCADCFERIEGF